MVSESDDCEEQPKKEPRKRRGNCFEHVNNFLIDY